ncbi:Lar family restriction alleviation protein [Desulfovibrio piger]
MTAREHGRSMTVSTALDVILDNAGARPPERLWRKKNVMDSPKLKPCPHCGVTTLTIRRNSMFEHYFVECDVCWMQGPRAFWSDSAVNKWNSLPRRHEIMPNDVDCAGCPERRYRSHDHD